LTGTEEEELDVHSEGLRQMVAGRGGFEVLSKVATVGWDLLWYLLLYAAFVT
jgi:hypothetical protein